MVDGHVFIIYLFNYYLKIELFLIFFLVAQVFVHFD
jgi:hypothetical protein